MPSVNLYRKTSCNPGNPQVRYLVRDIERLRVTYFTFLVIYSSLHVHVANVGMISEVLRQARIVSGEQTQAEGMGCQFVQNGLQDDRPVSHPSGMHSMYLSLDSPLR